MNKQISVIVPTYQRPGPLMECIKALARQQFAPENFEVIIVSDGPDLIAKQIVVSWKHTYLMNIQYIPLPEKGGPAAARNAGWRAASGTLIAFTDDDCLPDPRWLQSLWEAYQGQEYIAFTGRLMVPLPPSPTDFEWNMAQLENAEFVTANCACTRKALEKAGGFDEQFKAAWREDSDLEFRLLQLQVPIQHLPEAIVVHPLKKAPWGVSLLEQRKNVFNALLYKKFPRLYRSRIQPHPPWNYYVMVVCFFGAMVFLFNDRPAAALAAFVIWLLLVAAFALKRLAKTTLSWPHVLEMIVTSAAIPFVSIYWNLYGAWRYRVLYL